MPGLYICFVESAIVFWGFDADTTFLCRNKARRCTEYPFHHTQARHLPYCLVSKPYQSVPLPNMSGAATPAARSSTAMPTVEAPRAATQGEHLRFHSAFVVGTLTIYLLYLDHALIAEESVGVAEQEVDVIYQNLYATKHLFHLP